MPNLSTRSNLPEKMDDLAAPEQELRQNLRELEVINKLLGGYNVVLNALEHLKWPARKVYILDLGCGGGDMLRTIANWANKTGKNVELLGIDLNPVMINYANENAESYTNITFQLRNVFDEALLHANTDFVLCSLFCHHFEDEQLIILLKRMVAIAGVAVVINDLHRHWFAYHSINILTALFSKTYMVKYDAKLSVARAFKRKDWHRIVAKAGIKNYTLKWRWAFRWELVLLSM